MTDRWPLRRLAKILIRRGKLQSLGGWGFLSCLQVAVLRLRYWLFTNYFPGKARLVVVKNFNLELLRNFLVVSRMQSFSKASAYLYMDQSTISKQIKQLEKRFGITLFVRNAQGVQLTVDGRRFAQQAEQLLDDFQHLGQAAAISWRQLRIGIFDNIAASFCQHFLLKHFSSLGEVKISNEGPALVHLFNQGELDLIVVNGMLQGKITGRFQSRKIADEEMMVMGGRQSQAILHVSMRLADLKDANVLIAPDYCPVSQEIIGSAEIFHDLRQIDYTETMIQLVATSNYLTVLPAGIVKQLVVSRRDLFASPLVDLPKRPVTAIAREKSVLDAFLTAL